MNRVNRMAWPWRRWLALCLPLMMAPLAQAQQCNSSGFGINFGTVALGSTANVTAALPYKCQANANDTYYKVCLFVPEGAAGGDDMSGVNPRKMTNYNGGTVFYTLYGDAARTQVLGPLGSGYPIYTAEFMVPGGWSQPDRTLNVYGRAGPVPAGTAAGSYQAQISGIEIRYAWSNSGPPSDCMQAQGGSAPVGFSGAYLQVSNSCIASVSATDLDFGTVSSLATARDSTSTITLTCPPNTSWKLGLSNGLHASGTQRRMAGPAGQYVGYELYRDASRSQRWGNDTVNGSDTFNSTGNPGSITVHGRVPAQPDAAPGTYSDTVTITLEY